jgi:hypothetical protein
VLEEEILSDHNPRTAPRPEALGDSGQKVNKKNQYRRHSREDQANGGAARRLSGGMISVQNWQFESHTSSLAFGGVKGILKRCGLPPERRARVPEGVGDNAISFE